MAYSREPAFPDSPILFNLFVMDLLEGNVNMVAFPDDIILFHSDDKIQKINDKLQTFYNMVEGICYWLENENIVRKIRYDSFSSSCGQVQF